MLWYMIFVFSFFFTSELILTSLWQQKRKTKVLIAEAFQKLTILSIHHFRYQCWNEKDSIANTKLRFWIYSQNSNINTKIVCISYYSGIYLWPFFNGTLFGFFYEYFTTVFSFYLGSPYETNAKRDRGCIIIWEIDVQNWQQETVVVVPRRLSKTENNKKLLTTIYQ